MGRFSSLHALVTWSILSWTVSAGTTMTVSNWGDNPSKLPALLVYVPSTLASNPAIVVGLHPCGGSGSQFMSEFNIPSFADQLGFPVLYPTSNQQGGMNCWDVNSAQTLIHNGGGDSKGIAAMVAWALDHFNGDPKRVFGIGASSGAMMANVLAATYPDVFAGLASWSGIPADCFANATGSSPSSPDQSCAQGQKVFSAQKWGDLARGSDPGYSGPRPKMIITHGTSDFVVSFVNFGSQLAQWSNVLGVTFNHNVTNDPTANWKRVVYGDGTQLIGFEVTGGQHIPPFQGNAVFEFFGLLGSGSGSGGSGGGSSGGGGSGGGASGGGGSGGGGGCSTAKYGQCGGQGFTGCTRCASGSTCQVSNAYYSQCL